MSPLHFDRLRLSITPPPPSRGRKALIVALLAAMVIAACVLDYWGGVP